MQRARAAEEAGLGLGLKEAVALMRRLWQGDYQTKRGKHYTEENVRIFDLTEKPVEVAVAACSPRRGAARCASSR